MTDPNIRNLPVPYFSQRENTFIWKEKEPAYKGKDSVGKPLPNPDAGKEVKDGFHVHMAGESCGITCVCMVLHYLGIFHGNPNHLMEKFYQIYDQNFSKIRSNPILSYENLSAFISTTRNEGGMGIESEDKKNITLDDIKSEIAAGYPVIVNIAITHKDSDIHKDTKKKYDSGHYVVVRGFTAQGNIIINDPWGDPTVNNGRVISSGAYAGMGHYYDKISTSAKEGDNVVLLESEFKKQIKSNGKIFEAIFVKSNLWRAPFADCNNEAENKINFDKFYNRETLLYGGFPIKKSCLWHDGINLTGSQSETVKSIGPGL